MTVLIVLRALMGVRKYLIGLGNQLERFFGLFVSGVAIRMILKRKFSVGLLDLILAGIRDRSPAARNSLFCRSSDASFC